LARNREFNEIVVIEKAVNLFWNKGYNAVSTQDLIDDFGISRSSMYGAFKDKRSLFILALQHYRQTETQKMLSVLNSESSLIEKLSTWLTHIIKENTENQNCKGCFIVNTAIELAQHDNEILAIIQENRKNVIEALSQAIETAIKNKEITNMNKPIGLSNYFYNIINGLRVEGKVTKNKADYKDTIQIALSVLDIQKKGSR
jgi:TetR/AcrR family transcriptional regulator, transcriptional repressor for nem operon